MVTDFTYINKISRAFGADGLAFLGNPEHGVTEERAFVFVDNQDSQRGNWNLGTVSIILATYKLYTIIIFCTSREFRNLQNSKRVQDGGGLHLGTSVWLYSGDEQLQVHQQ